MSSCVSFLRSVYPVAKSGGVHVLLGSRDQTKGIAAARKLEGEGLDVAALTLDVTDAASIAAAAKTIDAKYGRLDILINNAGINPQDGTKTVSEQRLGTNCAILPSRSTQRIQAT